MLRDLISLGRRDPDGMDLASWGRQMQERGLFIEYKPIFIVFNAFLTICLRYNYFLNKPGQPRLRPPSTGAGAGVGRKCRGLAGAGAPV